MLKSKLSPCKKYPKDHVFVECFTIILKLGPMCDFHKFLGDRSVDYFFLKVCLFIFLKKT